MVLAVGNKAHIAKDRIAHQQLVIKNIASSMEARFSAKNVTDLAKRHLDNPTWFMATIFIGCYPLFSVGQYEKREMMQADIAKYAMWLFDRTVEPRENLPALFDLLRRKNPVGSESLTFRDFEALFRRWHWQQQTSVTTHEEIEFHDEPGEPTQLVDENDNDLSPGICETTQMLSPDAAPISDYHVVTEMLIEQLVATVKQYLAEGWTPLGGISRATSLSSASYWAQAMVKRQVN